MFEKQLILFLYLISFYGFADDKSIVKRRKKRYKFSIFNKKTEKNENLE